jgi:hypothetical protein
MLVIVSIQGGMGSIQCFAAGLARPSIQTNQATADSSFIPKEAWQRSFVSRSSGTYSAVEIRYRLTG